MGGDVPTLLSEHGVQPSAQRVAVARYVLNTGEHPSAERVLARVRADFPHVSRATVYNTLHLFVERGLLRELHLAPGSVVFDPNLDRHHHLVDEATGAIRDIPWRSVRISHVDDFPDFEVSDYQVVLRGRSKKSPRRARSRG